MRYITPLAEVTWEVWNRDNTFDAIYILYDVVPLRFHKGHHRFLLTPVNGDFLYLWNML